MTPGDEVSTIVLQMGKLYAGLRRKHDRDQY